MNIPRDALFLPGLHLKLTRSSPGEFFLVERVHKLELCLIDQALMAKWLITVTVVQRWMPRPDRSLNATWPDHTDCRYWGYSNLLSSRLSTKMNSIWVSENWIKNFGHHRPRACFVDRINRRCISTSSTTLLARWNTWVRRWVIGVD